MKIFHKINNWFEKQSIGDQGLIAAILPFVVLAILALIFLCLNSYGVFNRTLIK